CKCFRAISNDHDLRANWIHNLLDPLKIGVLLDDRERGRESGEGMRHDMMDGVDDAVKAEDEAEEGEQSQEEEDATPPEFDGTLLCPHVVLKLLEKLRKVRGVGKDGDLSPMYPVNRLLSWAPWWPAADEYAHASTTSRLIHTSSAHTCPTDPAKLATYIYNKFIIEKADNLVSLVCLSSPELFSKILNSMTTSPAEFTDFPHKPALFQYRKRLFVTLLYHHVHLSDDLPLFCQLLHYHHQPNSIGQTIRIEPSEKMGSRFRVHAMHAGMMGRTRLVEYIRSNPHAKASVKAWAFLGCLMGGHLELVQIPGERDGGVGGKVSFAFHNLNLDNSMMVIVRWMKEMMGQGTPPDP
ncbi:hypothetical protein HDV00_012719, partial [Rhizophlyctis rosea]